MLPSSHQTAREWFIPSLREGRRERLVKGDDRRLYLMPLDGARDDAQPFDVNTLADEVRCLVADLAPEPEAETYEDLRRVCIDEPERARTYLASVIRAAGRIAGRLPTRTRADILDRAPAMTNAEKCRASRNRQRLRAEETSRVWLTDWFDIAECGGVIGSVDLWQMAQRGIGELLDDAKEPDWPERAAEEGFPLHPVMPGRTTFLAVAAQVFKRRRRGSTGAVFVARAVELNDAEALADLLEQHHSSTTTPAAAAA